MAETEIVEARLAKAEGNNLVLALPSGPLAVAFDEKTKFWKNKAESSVDQFAEGEPVVARLKTDADPPRLREIADKPTWAWLEAVRKTPQQATVVQLDQKYLYVKLAIGGDFKYRITEKSGIELKDKNPAALSDLTPGLAVYIKGRTLATLDTWAVLVSDKPIAPNAKASRGGQAGAGAKSGPLPPSGTFEATATKVTPTINMIDVLESGRVLHVTYQASTRFFKDGKPAAFRDVQPGNRLKVAYKRDKLGRILASSVEILGN